MLLTIEQLLAPVCYRSKVPALPACSSVTELRLPQLNSSNGRTAWIFQILLLAQGISGWRQQQMLTCCFVQVLNLALESPLGKLATKMFDFSPYFVLTAQQEIKIFFFYIRSEVRLLLYSLLYRSLQYSLLYRSLLYSLL